MGATRRALVAIAAALALADASIIALALPPILVELDTTITGAAAVIGVYALALAAAILPVRRLGDDRSGPIGLTVFTLASLGCAIAPSLELLLLFRALQAVGGAAALLAAFGILDRRVWLLATLVGTAAGPAIGGALTEAFDWRAIFVVQAPLVGAAAIASVGLRPAAGPARRPPDWRGLIALGLVAAAFTSVLFLLVIELVAGFAHTPLEAAAAVSVLPLAAVAAWRIPGAPEPRALAGALLLAGGAAALAFLPEAGIAWTVTPQLLAGAGMGLAVPALSDERGLAEAARGLFARHAGIVVVLAILAPVATSELAGATERAILQGTALVLDAQLEPLEKLELAPDLLDGVDVGAPRAGLAAAVEEHRGELDPAVYDHLAARLDDVIVAAALGAFRAAYLIAAALALVAAALLARGLRRPAVWLAAAVAAGCAVVFVVESDRLKQREVVLADPCEGRDLPGSGGLTGLLQDEALKLLDRTACDLGVSREELALALFDGDRAEEFERRHGVNPRTVGGLLSLLGGLGGKR
jgi:MFS family permease